MKKWTRTRLKMTITSNVFCMLVGIYATITRQEGVAIAAISAVLSVTSMYSFSEGKRPSNNNV